MGETHETLNTAVNQLYELYEKRDSVESEMHALLGRVATLKEELTDYDEQLATVKEMIENRYGIYASPKIIREQLQEKQSTLPPVSDGRFFKTFVVLNPTRNDEININLSEEVPKVQILKVYPKRLVLNELELTTDEPDDRFMLNMLINNRLGVNRRQITLNDYYRMRDGSRTSESYAREKYGKSLIRLKSYPLWESIVLESLGKTHKKFYYIRHDVLVEPVPTAISYDE